MKTPQRRTVRGHQWRDLDALRADLRTFLQITYNHQPPRLHSALDYQTPAAFETATLHLKRDGGFYKAEWARG